MVTGPKKAVQKETNQFSCIQETQLWTRGNGTLNISWRHADLSQQAMASTSSNLEDNRRPFLNHQYVISRFKTLLCPLE